MHLTELRSTLASDSGEANNNSGSDEIEKARFINRKSIGKNKNEEIVNVEKDYNKRGDWDYI